MCLVISPPPDYAERKESSRIYEKKSEQCGKNYTNYAYIEKKPSKIDQNWKLSNSAMSTESLDLCQNTSYEYNDDNKSESDDHHQQKIKGFHLRQYEDPPISDSPITPISERKVTPFNPFSANRVESPLYAIPVSKQKSNYYAKRAAGLSSKNRNIKANLANIPSINGSKF